jgi:hypothetical protein
MTAIVDELLDRSRERDVQLELRHRAYAEGWEAGHVAGTEAGRQAEAAERDKAWNRIARPIARGGRSHAELERNRWTVRGETRTRETFGQPHPDDYLGQDGAV